MTDDLKELALAATPGPWTGFVDKGRLVAIMPSGRPGDICTFADPPSDADAAFMLAATPDAILDLIRERDEARRAVGQKHDEANRYVNEMLDERKRREAAEAALSAAQEEVARLRDRLEQLTPPTSAIELARAAAAGHTKKGAAP